MTINANQTVKELAVTLPGATRVFEQLGIDYCCGGGRTLLDACQSADLSFEEVTRSLVAAKSAEQTDRPWPNWQRESLAALTVHIVVQHHAFTKQELERLEKLFEKVCSRHGERHPELFEAQQLFRRLKLDLVPHMLKEEQVLFPYLTRLEVAVREDRAIPPPFFGTVRNPVRMMSTEHDLAGELLSGLRRVTGDFTPPADGCISYQTLYQALSAFEADLHRHIHLENNILFPRAIEMEDRAAPEFQQAGSEYHCHGH
ncbi:MAG TPA: iron-sulfur cluster repair di-iron protein [Blastocatellia bacterium]|nr:iron-sulfur cluster repair di-iron protein [Blastocatellia bacterium]